MADSTTSVGFPISLGDRLQEIRWARDAHVETQKTNFFSQAGMVAKARGGEPTHERRPGLPIVTLDDFTKGPGDEIRMRMGMQLTRKASNKDGDASSLTRGNASMIGQEEVPTYRDCSIYLALIKNSVGFDSPDWLYHRTSADLEEDAKDRLRDWLVENHEEAIFDAFHDKFPYFVSQTLSLTTVAHPNLYYANGHSGTDDMTSSDTYSENEVSRQRNFSIAKKVNPILIDGKKVFVVLADPYTLTDLRTDPIFREMAKDSFERGSDHPLVKGANFVHLGMLLYECDRVRRNTTGANIGQIAKMPVLGADAIAVAYGSEPRIVGRLETNYGDRAGWAIRQPFGATRTDFIYPGQSTVTATTNQSSAEWGVWTERDEFAT